MAEYYDRLLGNEEIAEWTEYLLGLLEKAGARKAASVLECGCGTGRITLGLAKAGYRITALDLSEDMLWIAQEKLRGFGLRANFVCADMKNFRLEKKCGAVVAAYDVVNYITEEDSLKNFFGCAYHNLTSGGLVLFDISSQGYLYDLLGGETLMHDTEETTWIWHNVRSGDIVTSDITLFALTNGLYKRYDERHVLRVWAAEQLKAMLRDVGFSEVRAYQFGTMKQELGDCKRIQFCAMK